MTRLSQLENPAEFIQRHIGPTPEQQTEMARAIGYDSLDALIDDTVPAAIRRQHPMDLPGPQSEQTTLARLKQLASQNVVNKSYIGTGYHDTWTPAVVQRNVLENPGWYTAYTPYQPEISQGRLEALLTFQQMILDLTGMDLANASMLDEGTAAAEAMTLLHRVNKRNRSDTFLVAADCHPQTIAVVQTRAEALGIDVIVGQPDELLGATEAFGLLLQYPGTYGHLEDISPLINKAHEANTLVAVAADIMALLLVKSPGSLGADVVVGNTQRFGFCHPRRLQTLYTRSHHRGVGGSPRQPGPAYGDANPGTTYPQREGHQQYLHRPGTAGDHGYLLCDVSRPRGPAQNRGAHPSSHRPAGSGPGTCRFQRGQQQLLRHPDLHRWRPTARHYRARPGAGYKPAYCRERPARRVAG
jgi:hypothetical protein